MSRERRFTTEQVRQIRHSTLSARALAEQYDTTHPTIIAIRHRQSYKDISDHDGKHADNEYIVEDPLTLLANLPDGYCPTIVATPPTRMRPAIISQANACEKKEEKLNQQHIEDRRQLINEYIRVMGPTGITFYLQSHDMTGPYGLTTLGAIFQDMPVRQILIWEHGGLIDRPHQSGTTDPKLPRAHQRDRRAQMACATPSPR